MEKEIINNIENNDYFFWYDRTEVENLIKNKNFTWYSTVYCTCYSRPNFLCKPYEEYFNLRIPLAWLCEHTNDSYIKEKISDEYKQKIIDFENYKINGKNIDELFSIGFSKILSQNLAGYIQFASRNTAYNAKNYYGKKRNYTAEGVKTNFANFTSQYFSNKKEINYYKNTHEKTEWINNVVALKEIFKLYILFTAASITKGDFALDKPELPIADEAVTGVLEKILAPNRDMTSVFMIDNTAYTSQNSFYLERLYTFLVINLQFTINDFKEIAFISKYVNDSLSQMFCFNAPIGNEIRRLTPKCNFNYELLKDISSPKISFIILMNILCKRKYLNINYKSLDNINTNYFQNNNFEKIYALKEISDKVDKYYNSQNTDNLYLTDLFKDKKILTLDEQNLILDFILPNSNEYKQKKQKVSIFYRHINFIKAIYGFIGIKRTNFTINFFDILYLSFVYFRLYKNNLPYLKRYQTKRNSKNIDGIWKKIIKNKEKEYEWLEVKYVAIFFEPYYIVWERVRNKPISNDIWFENIKKVKTEELENYDIKMKFIVSVIETLKKW